MATINICAIETCGKPVLTLGYCTSHYKRLRRHGDPLAGRVANGEPFRFYQESMRLETDECILWPYGKTPGGYGIIHVGENNVIVSRLACSEVNGPPKSPSMEAAHSCNNGHLGCFNKRHLSWKTRQENEDDKKLAGNTLKGEAHPASKLSAVDVSRIKFLLGRIPQKDIAECFGVARSVITTIKQGKHWGC